MFVAIFVAAALATLGIALLVGWWDHRAARLGNRPVTTARSTTTDPGEPNTRTPRPDT